MTRGKGDCKRSERTSGMDGRGWRNERREENSIFTTRRSDVQGKLGKTEHRQTEDNTMKVWST